MRNIVRPKCCLFSVLFCYFGVVSLLMTKYNEQYYKYNDKTTINSINVLNGNFSEFNSFNDPSSMLSMVSSSQKQHHHINANDICDNTDKIIGDNLFKKWQYIDQTVQQSYNNTRVSGGIFLYPRQASILLYLIRLIRSQINSKKTLTICETGFGSGHSMALFQEAADGVIGKIHIVSFDKFDRPYQLPIWKHFNDVASKPTITQEYVAGDSCKTVPETLSQTNGNLQCDIIHGSSLCSTDNIDLVEYSPCGVLLTSTAMNTINDRAVYFGLKAQWRKLRERRCISNIICFQESHLDSLDRDLVFAKKGTNYTGKFCVAMTTGKCQKQTNGNSNGVCTSDIHRVLSSIMWDEMCSKYQIEVPT